jgi:hypothetical protein
VPIAHRHLILSRMGARLESVVAWLACLLASPHAAEEPSKAGFGGEDVLSLIQSQEQG